LRPDALRETAATGQEIKPLAQLPPETPYKILIRRDGALIPAIQDCPSFFLTSEKAVELDADTAIL
jgi:hypothetical protein